MTACAGCPIAPPTTTSPAAVTTTTDAPAITTGAPIDGNITDIDLSATAPEYTPSDINGPADGGAVNPRGLQLAANGSSLNAAQRAYGNLRMYIRYGINLPDTDGFWNLPDPYIEVTAVDVYGYTVTRTTQVHFGTQYPVFNEWLFFGYGDWSYFKIRALDYDLVWLWNVPDRLSNDFYFYTYYGHHPWRYICGTHGCGGYVYFDYYLD